MEKACANGAYLLLLRNHAVQQAAQQVWSNVLSAAVTLPCKRKSHLVLLCAPDKSQSLMILSLFEAKVLPSGVNATPPTGAECPFKVAHSLPVARSQSLIVLSSLPEANVLPSPMSTATRIGGSHESPFLGS